MKKFIMSLALVGCFMMVAASTAQAQYNVKNNTSCDFIVKFAWGKLATCGIGGYVSITVPAGTVGVLPGISPYDILYGKGKPVGTPGCAFYIGQGCSPYPPSDTVSDPSCCGGYTASFIPGYGVYITN